MLSLPISMYTLKDLISTNTFEMIALKIKYKDKKSNYIHLLNVIFYR